LAILPGNLSGFFDDDAVVVAVVVGVVVGVGATYVVGAVYPVK